MYIYPWSLLGVSDVLSDDGIHCFALQFPRPTSAVLQETGAGERNQSLAAWTVGHVNFICFHWKGQLYFAF